MDSLFAEKISPADTEIVAFSKSLRIPAFVFSVVLHPLFVPLIGVWLIVQTHFFDFAGIHGKKLFLLYGSIISNALILPAFTVFFLWRLKFISSLRMDSKRERIIPYIAVMSFYFWTYMVFKNREMMPDVLKAFLLGNFIAVILAFISNLKLKISMHTLGMGGLLGLIFCFLRNTDANITLPLMAVIFAAGLAATCRMILAAHTYRELYLGFAFGIFAQILASWMI